MSKDTQRANPNDYTRWPAHTRLAPSVIRLHAQYTHDGHYNLSPGEREWRDLGPLLSRMGYHLRPRYLVGWTPSWIGTDIDPEYCEDSVIPDTYKIMDSTRDDGSVVVIKRVSSASREIQIGQLVSSAQWLRNQQNHAIPIFDIFPDPLNGEVSYIVLPLLRQFNDPAFGFAGEVLDFIGQTLQGLVFLHAHNIAHRNCYTPHIMMDGAPLYPTGYHPIKGNYSRDLTTELTPLPRIDHPTRYFFISFRLATQFPVPPTPAAEAAYKKDVLILGIVFNEELREKYHGLEPLMPLFEAMTTVNPSLRPTAAAAMQKFREINKALESNYHRTKLRPLDETVQDRIVRETMAAAKDGITSLRRLVGQ